MTDVEVRPVPSLAAESRPWKTSHWLALGLLLVLSATGAVVWTLARSNSAATESTLMLETFVVNLTGSGERAYLRVGITLGLAHPIPGRDHPERVPTALIRDTILSVLATAHPEFLLQSDGKRTLKNELLKALQDRVPQMAIQNVYFTEFLVQM